MTLSPTFFALLFFSGTAFASIDAATCKNIQFPTGYFTAFQKFDGEPNRKLFGYLEIVKTNHPSYQTEFAAEYDSSSSDRDEELMDLYENSFQEAVISFDQGKKECVLDIGGGSKAFTITIDEVSPRSGKDVQVIMATEPTYAENLIFIKI